MSSWEVFHNQLAAFFSALSASQGILIQACLSPPLFNSFFHVPQGYTYPMLEKAAYKPQTKHQTLYVLHSEHRVLVKKLLQSSPIQALSTLHLAWSWKDLLLVSQQRPNGHRYGRRRWSILSSPQFGQNSNCNQANMALQSKPQVEGGCLSCGRRSINGSTQC